MAGQEVHVFIARTRSQSEECARAEVSAVQRFEIIFSVNMMANSDHMFMGYKTNVEITSDRRMTNCARNSSRP